MITQYGNKIFAFAKWLIPLFAALFLLFGTDSGRLSEDTGNAAAAVSETGVLF